MRRDHPESRRQRRTQDKTKSENNSGEAASVASAPEHVAARWALQGESRLHVTSGANERQDDAGSGGMHGNSMRPISFPSSRQRTAITFDILTADSSTAIKVSKQKFVALPQVRRISVKIEGMVATPEAYRKQKLRSESESSLERVS